jgi:hypothetical protein
MGAASIEDGPTVPELMKAGALKILAHALRRHIQGLSTDGTEENGSRAVVAVGTIASAILLCSSSVACAEDQTRKGTNDTTKGTSSSLVVWCGIDIGLVNGGAGLVAAVSTPLVPTSDLQLNLHDLEGEGEIDSATKTREKLDAMVGKREEMTAAFGMAAIPEALVVAMVQVAAMAGDGTAETLVLVWAPVVWR